MATQAEVGVLRMAASVGLALCAASTESPGHRYAIDATLAGDVTGKAQVGHRSGEDFHRTLSTVAIKGDVVDAAALSGFALAAGIEPAKTEG